MHITRHACKRFCERIRETDDPRAEIRQCLMSANKAHLRKATEGRDWNVPLGCCVLVCNQGVIITVTPVTPNLVPRSKAKTSKKWRVK